MWPKYQGLASRLSTRDFEEFKSWFEVLDKLSVKNLPKKNTECLILLIYAFFIISNCIQI
ncbi:hypothetical protein BpHYR1_033023 [Brachionus plicatilis]|uniref:Uncharacterized protein n=1 Tax=Brachionus plicatilis TaxID=10195 RepID=A0A3M7QST3_BRAPC|nr:hypothetical protein BpHYR1_033023 [Brachionus plicatilis]